MSGSSRAKMKKWFEKWAAEKAKRNEKNLPAIVEYRDETYVSLLIRFIFVSQPKQSGCELDKALMPDVVVIILP
jgi:hypothetical protein